MMYSKPPYINTLLLEKEYSRNASAPMQFVGEDGLIYFVKYPLDSLAEFDDLAYEVICHFLARHFSIATPDIAFVNIKEGTFDTKLLKRNKNYLQANVVGFGSRYIGNNDNLDNSGRFKIDSKSDFKKLKNINDLIRAAIFDVHINNQDRHEENFNILLKYEGATMSFCFIDHVHVFGGPLLRGKINPSPINIDHKLVKSHYFNVLSKYISLDELKNELDNYIYLCKKIEKPIDFAFSILPEHWEVSNDLQQRVVRYLTDNKRIEQLNERLLEYFQYLKSR